jgi:hypothetical protein
VAVTPNGPDQPGIEMAISEVEAYYSTSPSEL